MFQKWSFGTFGTKYSNQKNAKRMLNHGFILTKPTFTQISTIFRGSETVQNQSNEVKSA